MFDQEIDQKRQREDDPSVDPHLKLPVAARAKQAEDQRHREHDTSVNPPVTARTKQAGDQELGMQPPVAVRAKQVRDPEPGIIYRGGNFFFFFG